MKAVYLIISLSFITLSAVAQQKFLNKKYTPQVKEKGALFPNFKTQPTAKLSGYSKWGTIYALPLDNMPCLVPDLAFIAPIPNYKNLVPGLLMPNPYRIIEIIPAQKNKIYNLLPE